MYQPACELPARGCFVRPTLFTNVAQSSRIAQEEIFGPVLSVLTFRTPDEAIEKANNTAYGLSAGVWTEKGSRILAMVSRLRAGVVWANTFNRFDPTSPFGGYKESGFGREGGLHGLLAVPGGGSMSERPSGTPRPYLLRPGERGAIWSLGGHFTTKADVDDTGGGYALVEAVAFRATEPPLHVHSREDEAWYVLDGQMTFQVGDARLVATTGCFAFAPRGMPHAFTVDLEPSRVLVLVTPAGFEGFAAELGVPAFGEIPPEDLALPPPDVLGPVAMRYGIEVVGPPMRVGR